MRTRIILAAGIAALAAGLVAAFGRGSSAAPASLGAGAAVAPANAAAFVAIDSDLGSSQWQAVDSLLAKAGVLTQLQQGFEQQTGLSWSDLQAAVGSEVDLVVLPGGAKPQLVLLTQPGDAAKLDALLAKAGSKVVSAQVNGWTAVSDAQTALDAVTGASQHLAGDATYQAATAKLSAGAFAQIYANGAEAGQLTSPLGLGPTHLVWAAADVVASDGGVKLDGYLESDGTQPATQPYSAQLLDRIPSGALLAADFQAGHESDAAATSSNPLVQALGKLGRTLGGETALYVTPSLPFPAVTLVTQASDPQAVLAAVGGAFGSYLHGLTLSHETVGGDLVVSTSQAAIDAFKGGGAKLSGDAAFQAAQAAAGMPAQTTGFVYVDLKDALPYVQSLLPGGGQTSLGALGSFLAYGTGTSGDVSTFAAFLGVR